MLSIIKFANFLLIGIKGDGKIDLDTAKSAIDGSWKLADAGIEIKNLNEVSKWSIRTRKIFLSDGLVDQVKKLDVSSSGVLTYLVNSIEKKSDKNQTKKT